MEEGSEGPCAGLSGVASVFFADLLCEVVMPIQNCFQHHFSPPFGRKNFIRLTTDQKAAPIGIFSASPQELLPSGDNLNPKSS